MVISKINYPPAQKKILTFVPARGGSKGIPRKNIVDLGGKPLIWYTLRTANASRYINRVIVSTDDPEIADVARHYGAEVPFLRPRALSQDQSNMTDAYNDAMIKLEEQGYEPDLVVTLFPTSPFREVELIDEMIEAVLTRCLNCVTVREILPRRSLYVPIGCEDIRLGKSTFEFKRKSYVPIGVCCVHTFISPLTTQSPMRSYLYGLQRAEEDPRFFLGNATECKVVTSPLALIDINTPEDLNLAREVIERGLAIPGDVHESVYTG